MASSKRWPRKYILHELICVLVKLPTPKIEIEGSRGENMASDLKAETSLPQTLVRIPIEDKPETSNGNS